MGPFILAVAPLLAVPVAADSLLRRTAAVNPSSPRTHPPIVLRDGAARPVVDSGLPLSAPQTCKGCHDTATAEAHSYHVQLGADQLTGLGRAPSGRPWDFGTGPFGRWDPITYAQLVPPGNADFKSALPDWVRALGPRSAGGGPVKPFLEYDCLVCHAREGTVSDRARAIAQGKFEEAASATLTTTGLLACACKDGRWSKDGFLPGGAVAAQTLGLGPPSDRACGGCHILVHEARTPLPLTGRPRDDQARLRMTETEGAVWSGQAISQASGVAFDGSPTHSFSRPWDVHAERGVTCIACHAAPGGSGDHGSGAGKMIHDFDRHVRPCQDCHDPSTLHAFLPQRTRHFAKLACESCHIPELAAPARSETDWTMLTGPGRPRLAYRGVAGPFDGANVVVEGYQPILLPRKSPDGKTRWAPANLVTSWFWVEDGPTGPRPIPIETLERAFLTEGGHRDHRPSLTARLDRNGDGKLTDDELVLDSPAKVAAVQACLVAAGAHAPRIQGEIQPYPLAHGIVAGRFAVRACSSCHGRTPRTANDFVLSPRAPAQVVPALVGDADVTLSGTMGRNGEGGLVLRMGGTRMAPYLAETWWSTRRTVLIVTLLAAFAVVGWILLGRGRGHHPDHDVS